MNMPTPATSENNLRYGYGESALGTVMAAESERGVAAIFVGDYRAKLLQDLEAAFPARR
jgi:hypothetical protein